MKELMQKALTVLSQRKDISAGAEQQGRGRKPSDASQSEDRACPRKMPCGLAPLHVTSDRVCRGSYPLKALQPLPCRGDARAHSG